MGSDKPHQDYFSSKFSVASEGQKNRYRSAAKFMLMKQPSPLGKNRARGYNIKNYQKKVIEVKELPLKIFRQSELRVKNQKRLQIEDFKLLASYSWTDRKAPEIFVPGSPRKWNFKHLPVNIKLDRGPLSEDFNRLKSEKDVFAPLFAALQIMQPSYTLSPVSIVCDGTVIKKFFDFCTGDNKTSIWKIECQLVNDTLFMYRTDKPPRVNRDSSSGDLYENNFTKCFSQYVKDTEASAAHYRVVEYDFGGVKWVVRWPTDVYVENLEGDALIESEEETKAKSWKHRATIPLHIVNNVLTLRRGLLIKPANIATVRACSGNKGKDEWLFQQKLPQHYFSQTETLISGIHQRDNFTEVQKHDLRGAFVDWEKMHQKGLGKMMSLFGAVIAWAKENRRKKGFCLIFRGEVEGMGDNSGEEGGVEVFGMSDQEFGVNSSIKEKFWGEGEILSR